MLFYRYFQKDSKHDDDEDSDDDNDEALDMEDFAEKLEADDDVSMLAKPNIFCWNY